LEGAKMSEPLIKIRELQYCVKDGSRDRIILDIPQLDIYSGELVLLEGKTGAGKSSLLALLGGLERQSVGFLSVAGEQINRLSDKFLHHFRRHTVGFLFQHFNLIEEFSTIENIEVALLPERISKQDREQMVAQAVELANCGDFLQQRVKDLSGGEQQRVALARALVWDPPLLLVDEPTAHLDQQATLLISILLKKLKQQGKTIVVVSHDPLLKEQLSFSQIINIEQGKVRT
jgi:putative ABC transport system ATP-binding protein